MRDIVHDETVDMRFGLFPAGTITVDTIADVARQQAVRTVTTKTRTIVTVVRDDAGTVVRVVETTGHLHVGVTERGSAWQRWMWDNRWTSRTASGRVVARSKVREPGKGVFWSSRTVTGLWSIDGGEAYRNTVVEHFGSDIVPLQVLYPLLGDYKARCGTHVTDPGFLAAFERTETAADLTRRLFGVRRVRKDLVKAVAQAPLGQLYLTWCLRGPDIPTDWLVDHLRAEGVFAANAIHLAGLRPVLRGLERRSVRRLLRERGIEPLLLEDTAGAKCHIRDPESFRDLHDRAWAIARRRKEDQRRREAELQERRERAAAARRLAFEATPEGQAALAAEAARQQQIQEAAEARDRQRRETAVALARTLTGAVTGTSLRLVAATTGDELIEWSNALENCMDDYVGNVRQGSTVVLVAKDANGAVVAGIEVTADGALAQLLGRRNRALPSDVHDPIVAHLADAGVDTTGHYWGRPVAAVAAR